jgi:hypothetical protein
MDVKAILEQLFCKRIGHVFYLKNSHRMVERKKLFGFESTISIQIIGSCLG